MTRTSQENRKALVDKLRASGAHLQPPVDSESALPEVGEILNDRFLVGSFLGSGGMGLVFHGEDLETGSDVVIKTLRRGNTRQELVRFVQEASINLPEHPNIVLTVSHFIHERRPYHVQESLNGRNLAEILHARQEDRAPHHTSEENWFDSSKAPRVAVKAIADIANALCSLHENGIIHRDLKPANIVWSGKGLAVLIDFGLAQLTQASSVSMTRMVVGTRAYMAPEHSKGLITDLRADIYSLGATLWHLLTGHPPVGMPRGGTIFGTGEAMDGQLLQILQTALEPNPKNRFSSASQFSGALRNWLIDESEGYSSKSTALVRRWIYFKRFELALGTSILSVGIAVLLTWYVFQYQVRVETEHQSALAADSATARSKQIAFFGGTHGDDGVFVEETMAAYLAMVESCGEMQEKELREARRAAIQLAFRTGSPKRAEPFLASTLGINWIDFEDACLDAGIHSGLGRYALAAEILAQARGSWPEHSELLESATEILSFFGKPAELDFSPVGMYLSSGSKPLPMVTRDGTVYAALIDEAGVYALKPLSTSGAFPTGTVQGACLVRNQQGELGRLFFLNQDHDPPEGIASSCGIYWQPRGSLVPPLLVHRSQRLIGLNIEIGLVPIDLNGDGQEEVFAPFLNTSAESFILRLVEDAWVVKKLPGDGADVHGVASFNDGDHYQLALATSLWNEGGNGFRIRAYDVSPSLNTVTPVLNLPLGPVQSWTPLRGWPAHSVATFSEMDESQTFGQKFRNARSGEIWLLSADDRHGLVPRRRLGGTPPPKRLGDTTSHVFALDLNENGRDEIYWAWQWTGAWNGKRESKSGLSFFVMDSKGKTLSLPLSSKFYKLLWPIRFASGAPGLIFGNSKFSQKTSSVMGRKGSRAQPDLPILKSEAQRVMTVRGEGPSWEGKFTIPSDWVVGDSPVLFQGDVRLVRSDFNSFAYLAMAMESENGLIEPEWSLGLTTMGGGSVYFHRLGAVTSIAQNPGKLGNSRSIQVIPGGWVNFKIIPSEDGSSLICSLTSEVGTPGGSEQFPFPIPMKPIPGAVVQWDWRSAPLGSGDEVRDRNAVMAFDWLGEGHPVETGFARTEEIKETVALGETLKRALADEDRESFETALRKLEARKGGPRSAIRTDEKQNCLARYYLDEFRGMFLR
jgi:serine/threonine protein kinase